MSQLVPPPRPATTGRAGLLGGVTAVLLGLGWLIWPLATLHPQAPVRPPVIPPTTTLDEEPASAAPTPAVTAAPTPPLAAGSRPPAPPIPPPTDLGEPTPSPLPNGQPEFPGPAGLTPSVPSSPVVLPTPAATLGERTSNGLGPAISVANGAPHGSRAGLPARNWIDQRCIGSTPA